MLDLVGYGRAFDLLTTCPRVGPADAIAMGLANREAPKGQGLAAAQDLADQLRRASPTSIRATKSLLQQARGVDPVSASEIEAHLFGDVWMPSEHKEALSAFSGKRRPNFRG